MQPSETTLNKAAVKAPEHRDECLSFSELSQIVGNRTSPFAMEECAAERPAPKRAWAPTADENAFTLIAAGR